MIQMNLWSRFLVILSGLVIFVPGTIFAQQATPNPIFVPLNVTKTTEANDTRNIITPVPSATLTSNDSNDSSTFNTVEKREHHVLKRPIALTDDKVHWVDRTYPYGGTQLGTHEVHLGVEFVNQRFTPVFAAEAGTVLFAGSDSEFPVGPYENYYGNVIIIEHDIMSLDGEPIFTLYGHLDRIEAEEGQEVDAKQRIGRVGSSGIAVGAHLHFEVRSGEPFDYLFTRNPELWLQHYVDHGLIAGYVHDNDGNPIYEQRLVIRSDSLNREIFTYGSDRVNSDPVWQENFIVGDLPANSYEIVMLDNQGAVVYRNTVNVEAYKTTFVDILVDDLK